uniref:Uncharacterized protein n=1 Tax=Nelumbo nucifera TaxID=4432 RepID=A0A822XTM9_NELNU|nr:TPA_asm: hypothetical protein HUJ06_023719 [Nelumbo nucifera]
MTDEPHGEMQKRLELGRDEEHTKKKRWKKSIIFVKCNGFYAFLFLSVSKI